MVKTEGYKLIHVHVDIFSRECKQCNSQAVKVLLLNQTLPTKDVVRSRNILDKLTVLTVLRNKEDEIPQTHHFQFQSTSSNLSIVFLSEGSCTRVGRIEASSFVCEQKITEGLELARTVAPAGGFTKVNISCRENAVNPGHESAYGQCSSEGIWTNISQCMCKEGFTFATIKAECKECPVNTYKDVIGNGKCNACPSNSKSDTGQHQCLCKEGFYRFKGDDITHPCHAKTEPSSSISTILVSVSVSVSVIFLLILSCGIIKHKRRQQTSKLSNPVSIPVDAVELRQKAFVVELTQSNEEPHSETPDELSILPHEENQNLVNSDEITAESKGEANNLPEDVKIEALEPSAYAELDKDRQDERDIDDYQKLLKHDSGY